EVTVTIASGLCDRVTAELLQQRIAEDECHHRLGDDPRGGHGRDVGTLMVRLRRFAGLDIDGTQRARHRRDRLHRRTYPQGLARTHAAFDTARTPRRTTNAIVGRDDLVMRLRAARTREFEAVTDFDTLDRLNSHQAGSQA